MKAAGLWPPTKLLSPDVIVSTGGGPRLVQGRHGCHAEPVSSMSLSATVTPCCSLQLKASKEPGSSQDPSIFFFNNVTITAAGDIFLLTFFKSCNTADKEQKQPEFLKLQKFELEAVSILVLMLAACQ